MSEIDKDEQQQIAIALFGKDAVTASDRAKEIAKLRAYSRISLDGKTYEYPFDDVPTCAAAMQWTLVLLEYRRRERFATHGAAWMKGYWPDCIRFGRWMAADAGASEGKINAMARKASRLS